MALFATQELGYAGTLPTLSAVSTSDTFVPDDRTFIWVKNTNGATRDITVVTTRTGVGGQAVADVVVTIGAATGEEMIGPFPYSHFAASGVATVNFTASAGVTMAVVRVPVPAGS